MLEHKFPRGGDGHTPCSAQNRQGASSPRTQQRSGPNRAGPQPFPRWHVLAAVLRPSASCFGAPEVRGGQSWRWGVLDLPPTPLSSHRPHPKPQSPRARAQVCNSRSSLVRLQTGSPPPTLLQHPISPISLCLGHCRGLLPCPPPLFHTRLFPSHSAPNSRRASDQT